MPCEERDAIILLSSKKGFCGILWPHEFDQGDPLGLMMVWGGLTALSLFEGVLAVVLLTVLLILVVYHLVKERTLLGPERTRSAAANVASASMDWAAWAEDGRVRDVELYATYHGLTPAHLARLHARLVEAGCSRFCFLAGDSSFDNKHWFFGKQTIEREVDKVLRLYTPINRGDMKRGDFTAETVNGYDMAIDGRMVRDVCYWLNAEAEARVGTMKLCALMSAVEASTLDDRYKFDLLAQDVFIREHVREEDTIFISVGGNVSSARPAKHKRTSTTSVGEHLALQPAPCAGVSHTAAPRSLRIRPTAGHCPQPDSRHRGQPGDGHPLAKVGYPLRSGTWPPALRALVPQAVRVVCACAHREDASEPCGGQHDLLPRRGV